MPKSARRMSVIASGYRSISTGNDQPIIVLSPTVDIKNETAQKPIAQSLYFGPFGNISQNVSPQLVISPTAVFRHARVTVTARIIPPTLPK